MSIWWHIIKRPCAAVVVGIIWKILLAGVCIIEEKIAKQKLIIVAMLNCNTRDGKHVCCAVEMCHVSRTGHRNTIEFNPRSPIQFSAVWSICTHYIGKKYNIRCVNTKAAYKNQRLLYDPECHLLCLVGATSVTTMSLMVLNCKRKFTKQLLPN